MNNVILVGRLTREPEKKSTPNGTTVTYITVAVPRPYKNSEGQYEADFINCVLWKEMGDNTAVYCHKGDQVCVRGRIQMRSYDAQDGSKRYVTEIIAEKIIFLTSKKEHSVVKDIETKNEVEDPYEAMGEEVSISEDDLPFDFE